MTPTTELCKVEGGLIKTDCMGRISKKIVCPLISNRFQKCGHHQFDQDDEINAGIVSLKIVCPYVKKSIDID